MRMSRLPALFLGETIDARGHVGGKDRLRRGVGNGKN
jgi:hypothetical protein